MTSRVYTPDSFSQPRLQWRHTHTTDAETETEDENGLLRLAPDLELMLLDTVKTKLSVSSPLR